MDSMDGLIRREYAECAAPEEKVQATGAERWKLALALVIGINLLIVCGGVTFAALVINGR